MRIIFTILLILATHSLYALNAKVYRIDIHTKQLHSEMISDMPNIKDIFLAGNYAWAISHENTVAFYDKNHWLKGYNIPEISTIQYFSPAFPITGEKPFAWLIGKDKDDRYKISFFDGNKWSEPKPFFNFYSIAVSAGHLFVLEKNAATYSIRITNINSPTNWIIKPLPFIPGGIISFNDKKPFGYLTGKQDRARWFNMLFRVDSQGNIKKIAELPPENQISVEVFNNDISFVNQYNKPSSFYFSHDNGDSWHTISTNEEFSYATKIFKNIFCAHHVFNGDKNHLYASCTDISEQHPEFHTFKIPNSSGNEYALQTYSSGARFLIRPLSEPITEKIYEYDLKKFQLVDTKSDSFLKTTERETTLPDNTYLACGHDLNDRQVLFYFNGLNWNKSFFSKEDNLSCHFSYPGNTYDGTSQISNENLWVF